MKVIPLEPKKENGITWHPVKKIEIIVKAKHEAMIEEIMHTAKVTGFTVIQHVAGRGHHGFHAGHLLFNDQDTLSMFIAVASEKVINQIAVGMKALFDQDSGVMFVSDVMVARLNYFS